MILRCAFAGLGFLFSALAFAATDRASLVEAGFNLFCPLVQHALHSVAAPDPLFRHKDFLRQVNQLCAHGEIKLKFEKDFSEFQFLRDEKNRFMGTGLDQEGSVTPIYVNLEILNGPGFDAARIERPLSFILQTLMHEYANKIPNVKQGVKDEVARLFGDRYARDESRFDGEGFSGVLLSLPLSALSRELKEVGPDDVQPTLALLLARDDKWTDLTSALLEEGNRSTSSMRTVYTESNRLALMMMPKILAELRRELETHLSTAPKVLIEQFREQLRRAGQDLAAADRIDFSKIEASMRKMLDTLGITPHEIRTMEVVNALIQVSAGGHPWLLLQGKLALNRAPDNRLHEIKEDPDLELNINGDLNEKKIIEVPVVMKFSLKEDPLDAKLVSTDLRPELNSAIVASVGQISRRGEMVTSLKVKSKLQKTPRTAHLRLANGADYILVQADSIETRGATTFFDFRIPSDLADMKIDLWAESLLLDQAEGLMLDRLIQVGEDQPIQSREFSEDTLLQAPGFVVQDFKGNVLVQDRFHPILALLAMNEEWSQVLKDPVNRSEVWNDDLALWFDVSKMELRFGLPEPHRLREVRLQMIRDVTIGELDPEHREARPSKVTIDGQLIPVSSDLAHSKVESHYETLVFTNEELQFRKGMHGTVVIARKSIGFKPLTRPLKPNELYAPQMIRPLKLEVVLADKHLTTIRHEFPLVDLGECNEVLKSGEMDFKFNSRFGPK